MEAVIKANDEGSKIDSEGTRQHHSFPALDCEELFEQLRKPHIVNIGAGTLVSAGY